MFSQTVCTVFLILSALCFAAALCAAFSKTRFKFVSVIVRLIIGTFAALFLLCLPMSFASSPGSGPEDFLRLILFSVHETVQIFVANLDASVIYDSVSGLESGALRVIYSTYGTLLFVFAPFLTFGAVLSFFRNFVDDIRYVFSRRKPLYIFSELNERSVVLAKSVLEDQRSRPMIVFCGVSDDSANEFLPDAKDIHAVLLEKEIVHLDLLSKKQDAELFMIGEDESENVRQAAIITGELDKYGKKQNVKIFVFAVKESSRCTLDSLEYDNLLNKDTVSEEGGSFKLRRINCVRQLAWRTVPMMDVIKKSRGGVVSVMIAGMGSYGSEFFKTLMWFCRIDGLKLEINLFDKAPKGEHGGIESALRRYCPELIEKNGSEYDIMMFDGIDFTTDGFASLLEKRDGVCERLRRTDIAVVCTGDDDLNIETAVYLREIFDRINGICGAKSLENELPDIYSVVYDSRKYGSVSGDKKDEYLKNHREQKYHIRFIGSLDEQYSYKNVYSADDEATAFEYHNKWSKTNAEVIEARLKFDRFEFYRQSSLASAIHHNYLKKSGIYEKMPCLNGGNDDKCECKNCARRKIAEHARWAAYMRAEGYSYRSERFDRAKLHNDLTDWGELSSDERSKDQ